MKYIEPKFPQHLLDATPEQKLEYFERKVLSHPHLEQAYNYALDCIEFSSRGEIVPIVGPTGVGTTELGRKLWRDFHDVATTCDEAGRVLPLVGAIGFEAPNAGDRIDKDYWKRVMARMLHQGGDILSDRKIYVPPSQFTLTHPIPHADPMKKGVDTLLQATVNMLEHRQTRVVVINQADRLFPESDKAGCHRSQQILMDLAAQTRARFVLIGGYQLVRVSCARNNWLRRQHTVHFRRYDHKIPEEMATFRGVLVNLLAHMPIAQRLDSITEEWVMQFYICTVGCIGTLKKTLMFALQCVLRGRQEMTRDFILYCAQYNVVSKDVALQACEGERLLMDVSSSEVEQILNSGWPPADSGQGGARAAKPQSKSASGMKTLPGRRRIGERRSSRDPVGGRHG